MEEALDLSFDRLLMMMKMVLKMCVRQDSEGSRDSIVSTVHTVGAGDKRFFFVPKNLSFCSMCIGGCFLGV